MAYARRLRLIQSHLTGRFGEVPPDSSLDNYRSRGLSFDKSELRSLYYPEAERNDSICALMQASPLFNHQEELDMSREELRERAVKQVFSIYSQMKITKEQDQENGITKMTISCALANYRQALGTLFIVNAVLYLDTISNLGTEKHIPFVDRCYAVQDIGCFCMTEIGHGTNVNGIETTAAFDPKTREFVINSPTPTSAKWWIGGLAKNANMAVVFAQLYIENSCKGVHAFVIPIRDRDTHEILDGCVIGDCGPKIGVDSIDNGFVLFHNYRASYDSLLDKLSNITPEGKFKSSIKNHDKRFSAMLGGLIRGRMAVVWGSEINLRNAMTVAIRYSAVRKQFGSEGKSESPILDYQLQRYRLIPYLAKLFGITASIHALLDMYKERRKLIAEDPECPEGAELHAILSAAKVLGSWYGVQGIQECREACGGHGYSKFAILGNLKMDQDVQTTWEGDNNVLIQQTAKFILKHTYRTFKGQKIEPACLQFIKADGSFLTETAIFKCKEDFSIDNLLAAMRYRVNLHVYKSLIKLQENSAAYESSLEVWNNTQVNYLHPLALSFGELFFAEQLFSMSKRAKCPTLQILIQKLASLYAVESIYSNLATYLESYLTPDQAHLIREFKLDLCNTLAENSINLIDAIATPDKLLGSVLGQSDGQVYKHYILAVEKGKGVYEKARWSSDLINYKKS